MTYIGDGGQSTGVTYEGLNFAAVQNLGLVLIVENNLWGYSTPPTCSSGSRIWQSAPSPTASPA